MSTENSSIPVEKLIELEERKIRALETIAESSKSLEVIANSVDILSLWFEEIDKEEWSDRIQFYLAEFMAIARKEGK